MKVEFKLFAWIGGFFTVVGLIYGTVTHWNEPVGPFGLLLCAGLSALIGFYLWWTGRKLDPRPEDDPLALISVAEGEYGFFSPHSWWPLPCGGRCSRLPGPGGRLVAVHHRVSAWRPWRPSAGPSSTSGGERGLKQGGAPSVLCVSPLLTSKRVRKPNAVSRLVHN